MISTKEIEKNPDLTEVIKSSISGGFVPLEDVSIDETELLLTEFLEPLIRYSCPKCGLRMSSPEKEESYQCHRCSNVFDEPERKQKGFKLDDYNFENFIPGYEVKICENPTRFMDKKIEDTNKKFILFSNRERDQYTFLDGSGAFVELSLNKLEQIIKGDLDLEEIIEELRNKRKRKIEWSKLNITGRKNEMQHLTYQILEEEEDFRIVQSGGRGNEGGVDGVVYYEGGQNPRKMMLQCKRNVKGSLSRKNIRNMVADAEDEDFEGLLISAVNVSGDAMNRHKDNEFSTQDIHPVFIWQAEKLESMLSKKPHLIRDFFF